MAGGACPQSPAMDLDVVFLGTSASAPTARRGVAAHARAPRRRAAAVRLRRGDAAPAAALDVGLLDLRGDLPHALPRGPLPRPAGDAQDVRAPRARRRRSRVYGPRGLDELFEQLRRIFGKLTYPLELVELEPGEELERGDYAIAPFAVDARRRRRSATRSSSASGPGRFDVAARRRARRPVGPERGRAPARRGGDARRRTHVEPAEVLGRGAPRAKGRAHRRHRAVRRSSSQAAQGADLLVHEASFLDDEGERARETLPLDGGRRRRGRARRRACGCSRSRTSRRATSGRSSRDEAREVFPDTVVPRDFDIIEVPFPERGAPQLVKGGARPAGAEPAAAPSSPTTEEADERDGSGGGRGRRRRGGGDAGDPPQRRHRLVDRAGARGRRA